MSLFSSAAFNVAFSDQVNDVVLQETNIFWDEDYDRALDKSLNEQKPLFVLFTGSDWCKNCQVLEESILSRSTFIAPVKERFVFVKIDYPLKRKLSELHIKRNQELKEEFQINGFPTAVICLPTGEKLFFAGRFPLEPRACADFFLKEVDKAYDLSDSLKHVDENKKNLTVRNLEELYKKAKLFGKENEAAMILKIGVEKEGDNSFFLQEKYRILAEADKLEESEAQDIKNKLFGLNQESLNSHKLYVAVCDFQSLSKKICDSQKVSAPLTEYLKEFGSVDTENNWRVELMLAHYHSAKKEKEKALEYLKLALKDAPQFLRADIEDNVAKLESQ